jgi:hypothetical protein
MVLMLSCKSPKDRAFGMFCFSDESCPRAISFVHKQNSPID